MPVLKRCFRCERELPRTEFYVHPRMTDGLLGKCKACSCADNRANYAARREEKHAYDRARYQRPERRAYVRAAAKRKRARDPVRAKAWRDVSYAVRSGKLVRRPCEVCGEQKVQAHHDDYTKPLAVRWLCFTCHRVHGHGQVVTARAS